MELIDAIMKLPLHVAILKLWWIWLPFVALIITAIIEHKDRME